MCWYFEIVYQYAIVDLLIELLLMIKIDIYIYIFMTLLNVFLNYTNIFKIMEIMVFYQNMLSLRIN